MGMKYLGGKSRGGKGIAAYLSLIGRDRPFVEPFVGGLNITPHMERVPSRTASDACEALIVMYQALQKGWKPPDDVSEEAYNAYRKTQDPQDPATAFIGFGCSFGAKWYACYARDPVNHTNYAASTARSLAKTMALCRDVSFLHQDYRNAKIEKRSIVYCDPPYLGVAGYDSIGGNRAENRFSHPDFWEWVRDLERRDSLVYVSEYAAPDDFIEAAGFDKAITVAHQPGGTRAFKKERLFRWNGRDGGQRPAIVASRLGPPGPPTKPKLGPPPPRAK